MNIMNNDIQKSIPEMPITELSWENLLARREAVLSVMENLEAEISVIKDEILARLAGEGIEGKIVGDKNVSLRTTYTLTDRDVARELGCLKVIQQERIDNSMVKKMVLEGIKNPAIQINKTPIITEVKKKDS